MKRSVSVESILRNQRILSRMSGSINLWGERKRVRSAVRKETKLRLEILARWENPPILGRPTFFSLADKHQLKFDL